MTSIAISPSLSIVICESLINRFAREKRGDEGFVTALNTQLVRNFKSQTWKHATTNSSHLARVLSLPLEETQDKFVDHEVCRYLWGVSHILAFWNGEESFQPVLEATHRMKRKLRLYVPNESNTGLTRVCLKTLK